MGMLIISINVSRHYLKQYCISMTVLEAPMESYRECVCSLWRDYSVKLKLIAFFASTLPTHENTEIDLHMAAVYNYELLQ